MNEDPAKEKERLRRELKARMAGRAADEDRENSTALCDRLLRSELWRKAAQVLAFHPLRIEPDIRPLMAAALREGKRLALPRFRRIEDRYEPVWVSDLEKDLEPGVLGILEPRSHCPSVPINQLDLVLVPGLGFDLECGRLGRGRGYYDRLLADMTGAKKCGVAFDWQVVERVPMQAHDIPVDYLVTPTRWLSRTVDELGCE